MKRTIAAASLVLIASLAFAGSNDAFLFMPAADPLLLPSPPGTGIDSSRLPEGRPTILRLILGGVVGNVAGTIGLVMLGNEFPSPGDEIVATAAVVGGFVGLIGGSALGVTLAGNTGYWRGNFGSALLGSTMGLFSAFLVTAVIGSDYPRLGLLSVAVLPPVGAAILFNSSLRPRRLLENQALLNISAGRLGLGVPDIQVRPLYVPGLKAKPELRFNVRVLSLEL